MNLLERIKKRLTGKGFRDVHERLQFYIIVSEKLFALGLFSILIKRKLELEKYFGPIDFSLFGRFTEAFTLANLKLFLMEKGFIALLAIFTTVWYFIYAWAVRTEMKIIVDTFSRFKPPQNWEEIVGKNVIPLLSIGVTMAFLALAWSIDNLKIYCVILLTLNVLDIRGNNVLRQNLTKHFADKRFLPEETEPDKDFIMRRRAIAEDYWVNKPQLERIGMFMIATSVAFLGVGASIWIGWSYLLLITAILLNEITMYRWRKQRNLSLDIIDDAQIQRNRERIRKTLPNVPPEG